MRHLCTIVILFCIAALAPVFGVADSTQPVLQPVKVAANTWAIVGPLTNRTAENLGNNATFGLVVTREGAVLIDAGGSYLGAQQLHEVIKSVTDQPVRYVINTGGQDHRWFGNDYFIKQGAKIIASKVAVEDQRARFNSQWTRMVNTAGTAALKGTVARYADIVFDNNYTFTLGEVRFEIYHAGQAHTPGDSFVWLPGQKTVFAGDIAFATRMLNVSEYSYSKTWLTAFEAMAALGPAHVVPGHGPATDLQTVRHDTYDYLRFLRTAVARFMEEGHDISDIGKVDQSAFSYLLNFDSLAGRNMQKVYREMEWE